MDKSLKCYLCENEAVASCSKCYRPVCAIHIVDSIAPGNVPVKKCIPCAARTRRFIRVAGIITAVVIMVVILIVVFSIILKEMYTPQVPPLP
jgi:hypothetical protein